MRSYLSYSKLFACVMATILGLWCCCTGLNGIAGGGGTETVVGKVYNSNGTPASRTVIEMLPADFNPVISSAAASHVLDTTDADGSYSFTGMYTGTYTIQAVNPEDKTRALDAGFSVEKDRPLVLNDTLRNPGTIKVMLPDNAVNSYLYIPGTSIGTRIGDNDGSAVLHAVPVATLSSIKYGVPSGSGTKVIRYAVRVIPDDTVVVALPAWTYSRQLYLNTSASGANVPAPAFDFPVLVRLSSGNFPFGEAKSGGEDVRFTKSDGTPLRYEIERWDAAQAQAEIWVKVDTVYGNSADRYIFMYWGNPDAVDSSNSAAVFDTTDGFQGVWHLGESATPITFDATGNHFDGMMKNMGATSAVPGAIGFSREFNGSSSFIQMPGTATGKLDFPAHGVYAVSAWVSTNILDSTYRMIVSKGDFQYNLETMAYNATWEFAECQENQAGWDVTQSPAVTKTWTYVVGMRIGVKQYLFVNGVLADTSIEVIGTGTRRFTGYDLAIGRKVNVPDYFFDGKIDEVRISSGALSPAAIRLCYMNQKADDALVIFK